MQELEQHGTHHGYYESDGHDGWSDGTWGYVLVRGRDRDADGGYADSEDALAAAKRRAGELHETHETQGG